MAKLFPEHRAAVSEALAAAAALVSATGVEDGNAPPVAP